MEILAEKISDSELEIMRTLWDGGDALPLTEIRREVQKRTSWEATTIKTLIQRLCTKGVLAQEHREVFYYRPLVSREEYNEYATRDLISRAYRGSARELVAALLRTDTLSVEDVEELRDFFNGEGKK